ncbi:hypothetical protein K438DRAFT_1850799 [Mycena galopus ATCC 62051]|nr:hypothetical protein K438DRAFT_1850799 [Mycena galopus ATCC 62051]
MGAHKGSGFTNSTASILPSRINRFPAELLVEIFALCWASFTPRFANVGPPEPSSTDVKPPGPSTSEDDESAPLAEDESAPPGEPAGPNVSQVEANLFQDKTTPAKYEIEIARVAHAPLLIVASVCSKWRAIAMGTPALWCEIELDSMLLDTPSHTETVLGVLQAVLTRGGTLSLDLMLAETDGHTFPSPVLDMLAAHSERWQTLTCPYSALDAFTALRGKLPRLQNLEIDLADWDDPQSLDILRGLPSLTYLSFPALYLAEDMGKLPLAQLTRFECTSVTWRDTYEALALMVLLPTATEYRLTVFLGEELEQWLAMDTEPQTSNISTLYIQFLDEPEPDSSRMVLDVFFPNLTLPLLTKLELESDSYPRYPPLWPHAQFLALSARSDFDSHLTSLEIYEVHITKAQLLECLSGLHSLERLAISDHVEGPSADQLLLITDTLLARFIRTVDAPQLCLVPRLSSFGCETLLQFDDRALLALAVSRLEGGTDGCHNGTRFNLELNWLPGHKRELDEAVLVGLEELKVSTKRRFTFRMSAAEDMWF